MSRLLTRAESDEDVSVGRVEVKVNSGFFVDEDRIFPSFGFAVEFNYIQRISVILRQAIEIFPLSDDFGYH